MQLYGTKLISIVSLALGSLLIGLLPVYLSNQNRQRYPLVLSALLCFGGGVLLSTSIVHILPEIREALNKNQEYSEIIFCIGFFILYIIDEIVHYIYGDVHENHHISRAQSAPSFFRDSVNPKYTYGATERDPLIRSNPPPYNPSYSRVTSENNQLLFDDQDERTAPSQLCHVAHQVPCSSGPVASLSLLVALSIHALLEGLVVGLEVSSTKVLLLLGAIASHKFVVAFCLGMELSSNSNNTRFRNFICILIFALGSVVGIIAGMAVSNLPKQLTKLTIPVLQGFAGGTLFYVCVSEILPRERARWHQQHQRKSAGIVQFISVALGFAVMTGLSKYFDRT